MKAALLLAYLPNDAEANRELPKFKIPENVPDKFPEAELEQLGKKFCYCLTNSRKQNF